MATSREDARPLQRCGWRANGRLRYPTIYTTSWDTTCKTCSGSRATLDERSTERACAGRVGVRYGILS